VAKNATKKKRTICPTQTLNMNILNNDRLLTGELLVFLLIFLILSTASHIIVAVCASCINQKCFNNRHNIKSYGRMGLTVVLVFVQLGLYSKFPVPLFVGFLLYIGFLIEDSLY